MISNNLIPLAVAEARMRQGNHHPNEPSKGSKAPFEGFEGDQGECFSWTQPKLLPSGLLNVASFDDEFLPRSIAPWVLDISERMQCPPDFLGASAMVGLSAVLGRKIGVRPQRNTDWIEVPNLWGCVVARPGAMKSPAMSQAFAPLHRLEANARKGNMAAAAEYAVELEAHKLKKEEAARRVRAVLKEAGKSAEYWTWRSHKSPSREDTS
jgi:hypothetical protein